MRVDNAIIMAAGTSSRFCPLSHERPKALWTVRGEVLIERQIRQLHEAGVRDVFLVTGYKAEQFAYLQDQLGVSLIHNADFLARNNNGSIWVARDVLANSYLCSSDNYFTENPFIPEPNDAYYAAEFAEGETAEWCMGEDEDGYINSVTVGGAQAWYMLGHTFWSERFSATFLRILEAEYDLPGTADKLWESIYAEHLDELKMRIRKYAPGIINEFDTLDELRDFDPAFRGVTGSATLARVAGLLGCAEGDITNAAPLKGETFEAEGFEFDALGSHWRCAYADGTPTRLG